MCFLNRVLLYLFQKTIEFLFRRWCGAGWQQGLSVFHLIVPHVTVQERARNGQRDAEAVLSVMSIIDQ